MSKMIWDQTGEKVYETGVEQCALFPQDATGAYSHGVPWNGLTNITEKPTGAEPTKLYANNGLYATLMSAEELEGSIEAYTYPDEFAACDGSVALTKGVYISQQTRQAFGLAYKSLIGNDVADTAYGYKLHLIYGAKASPTEKASDTVNDNPEARTLSWEFSTTPVAVTGYKPTASVEIDSTKVDADKLAALEAIIYGDENTEPRLPLPDEVATIMAGENVAG